MPFRVGGHLLGMAQGKHCNSSRRFGAQVSFQQLSRTNSEKAKIALSTDTTPLRERERGTKGRVDHLLLRLTNAAFMLVLSVGFSWAQADSTKPATYTLEPVKISNAAYPPQAREQKVQGRVVAMTLVSENGDVENVQVFKADPLLSQAAEETIRQWKFKPVTKDGKGIPVIAKVTLNFVLGSEDQHGITPEIAPATHFPEHVRVSSTVMEGLLLSKVDAIYPNVASSNRTHGVAVLAIVIGKDGTLTDAQVVSGPPELAPAALNAVRQWRYRPYQLLGRAVEVQATVQFNFR